MAKRDDKKRNEDKLERTIRRNWIICAATGIAIVALMLFSKG